jgi:hypothetical protein
MNTTAFDSGAANPSKFVYVPALPQLYIQHLSGQRGFRRILSLVSGYSPPIKGGVTQLCQGFYTTLIWMKDFYPGRFECALDSAVS